MNIMYRIKKFGLIVMLLIPSPILFARVSLGVSADISSAWVRPVSIEADVRAEFSHNLRFRVGVQYDRGNIKDLVTLSPSLDYSPFGKDVGLFLGIAPVDVAFLINSNKPRVLIMNNLSLGIKQSFLNNIIFVELRLSVRDPTTLCKNNLAEIQRYVTSYSRFKFRFSVGFNFDIVKDDNNTSVTKRTTTTIVETSGGNKTTKTTETKSTPKKSTTSGKKKASTSSKNTDS